MGNSAQHKCCDCHSGQESKSHDAVPYEASFDEETGAGYVKFSRRKVATTTRVGPLYVDFDSDGGIVGLEWFESQDNSAIPTSP